MGIKNINIEFKTIYLLYLMTEQKIYVITYINCRIANYSKLYTF